MGMSYLTSLNTQLFKNIAYVGSFGHILFNLIFNVNSNLAESSTNCSVPYVKFGWTNDWEYKKGCWYDDGLNQPKHIFLLKKVDDMRSAEKKLIEFAKESPYFSETPFFGKGWFETDLSDSVLESLFNYLLE